MVEQEKFFWNSENIKITNARAIFRDTTYALANITSVKLFKQPPSKTPTIILVIVGLILGGAGLCVFSSGNDPGGIVILVLGVAAIGFGIYISTKAKPNYFVRISSSSGEVDALQSKDRAFIQSIVDAVNQAIIERG